MTRTQALLDELPGLDLPEWFTSRDVHKVSTLGYSWKSVDSCLRYLYRNGDIRAQSTFSQIWGPARAKPWGADPDDPTHEWRTVRNWKYAIKKDAA